MLLRLRHPAPRCHSVTLHLFSLLQFWTVRLCCKWFFHRPFAHCTICDCDKCSFICTGRIVALSQFCPTEKSCRCPAKVCFEHCKRQWQWLIVCKMCHYLTLSKAKLEWLFGNKAKSNKRALGHKHLCLSSILLYVLLLMVASQQLILRLTATRAKYLIQNNLITFKTWVPACGTRLTDRGTAASQKTEAEKSSCLPWVDPSCPLMTDLRHCVEASPRPHSWGSALSCPAVGNRSSSPGFLWDKQRERKKIIERWDVCRKKRSPVHLNMWPHTYSFTYYVPYYCMFGSWILQKLQTFLSTNQCIIWSPHWHFVVINLIFFFTLKPTRSTWLHHYFHICEARSYFLGKDMKAHCHVPHPSEDPVPEFDHSFSLSTILHALTLWQEFHMAWWRGNHIPSPLWGSTQNVCPQYTGVNKNLMLKLIKYRLSDLNNSNSCTHSNTTVLIIFNCCCTVRSVVCF